MTNVPRLPLSLLALRWGVFIVMFVWALDKLVQPDHAARVFQAFYLFPEMPPAFFAGVGIAQLALVIAFVAGLWKTFTYGAVFALHAISTLSSWKQYLQPFDHLLFFAAWPMLAACLALFLLREHDTLGTLGR